MSGTITMVQRTDKQLQIRFTNVEVDQVGQVLSRQPMDITGYSVVLSVKRFRSDLDSRAIMLITQETHDDPVNGQTSIEVSAEDSKHSGTFEYELRLIAPDGKVEKSQAGQFVITEDV